MSEKAELLEHLFQPIQIGTMRLRNRVMMPPHGGLVGNLWGTRSDAEKVVAYWASRARDGVAWIDGMNGWLNKNITSPGFLNPGSGAGSSIHGVFRLPCFMDHARMYADAVHEAGACVTAHFTLQGGLPHSPSARLANFTNNLVPHALTVSEIRGLVEEYAFSAGRVKAAGIDGVELHANHEDVLQLFMSPETNRRDDEYGGDFDRRLQFIREIFSAIRSEVGKDFTLGIRMNMDEFTEAGYDVEGGIAIAKALEATGHIDFFHGVVGNNWGAPSYIQSHHYDRAQWSSLAGRYKEALSIPVIHTGRINDGLTGAKVIAQGHADVVGMARSMFAEPNMVSKARAGKTDAICPCIGCNDCLHTLIVEGMPFGCSVNPRTGHEGEGGLPPVEEMRRVLVVGAGPAGLELSALLAERGYQVTVWEQGEAIGGQMRIASNVPENRTYADFLDFQERRLQQLGVTLTCGKTATADEIVAFGADVVALATGAAPRDPEIAGGDLPFVMQGRDVMAGKARPGDRVVVIAMEDHMQPLTIASYLVEQGKQVRIIYQTPGIAPLVGKYSIGAPMARLTAHDVQVRVMERVVEIAEDRLATRNVYSGAEAEVTEFDSVVLACGGRAESTLFDELQGRVPELHILGDAYAPRRIWHATRQAHALALTI